MDTIFQALVQVLAVDERRESFIGNVLESFRATDVTRIGVDLQERFNFGNPSDNTPDSDKTPKI
jgi:hypothetical protein